MRKPQPIKDFQRKRLFGLAKFKAEHNWQTTHEYLGDLAFVVTRERTSSLKELTFAEANDMISSLGGVPFSLFTRSRRTENYRKQVAGVKTIETDAHLKLIDELAAIRGWTQDSLIKFCQRVIKKDSPVTTDEGNKIVEGLKAMNRRDGLLKFSTPHSAIRTPHSAEPSFRRVA